MKYTVRITETLVKDLYVEADSEAEAIEKVINVYRNVGIEVNEITEVTITIPEQFRYEDEHPVDAWIDEALLDMGEEV